MWPLGEWRRRQRLLLGPLAVDPSLKNAGIGSALMRHAIAEAGRLGHRAILLVGDAPYYGRFGFSAEKTGSLAMPGPYERHRLLALELVEGALDGAHGRDQGVRAQAGGAAHRGPPGYRGKPSGDVDTHLLPLGRRCCSSDHLAQRHRDRHVAFDLDLAGHERHGRVELAGDQRLEIVERQLIVQSAGASVVEMVARR